MFKTSSEGSCGAPSNEGSGGILLAIGAPAPGRRLALPVKGADGSWVAPRTLPLDSAAANSGGSCPVDGEPLTWLGEESFGDAVASMAL